MTLWLAILAALLVAGVSAGGLPNVTATTGEPWPQPQFIQYYQDSIDQLFRVDIIEVPIVAIGNTCKDMDEAMKRYEKIIYDFIVFFRRGFPSISPGIPNTEARLKTAEGPAVLTKIEVDLKGTCHDNQYPEFGMDESYEIKANKPDERGRAVITADTIWGIYRGLETMAQLFYSDDYTIFVHSSHIQDFPRYSHRGFLLDTGRHFLSVNKIKENLDLMAYNKYNVFHWHIVDDPSFPFYSERLFFMAAFGAFRGDKIYNPDNVADVIEYARQRGIRVIPEFDTPGHTRSWGGGLPGILTECYKDGEWDGTNGPIDPSKEDIYLFIAELLAEVTSRFPDKYLHLGGDEANFGYECWLSNPHVQQWMQKLNITTGEEVEGIYINRLLQLVERLPERPQYMVWQDVIDHADVVADDTIVQVWKEPWQDEMNKITALGHRTILSTCWYLNRIHYGVDWAPSYLCEPESFGGTEQQLQNIIGGEAAMWGEYVDEMNVVERSWPKGSAPAERLWSAKNVTSLTHAAARLEEHRCRMVYRGLRLGPANGPGFC